VIIAPLAFSMPGHRCDAATLDQLTPAVRSLNLDGQWQLSYGPITRLITLKQNLTAPPKEDATIPATVPGDAELDMEKAGILKDARIGKNVYDVLKYENDQWWYRRSFITPQPRPGEQADLVFNGLDTIGAIWVNGKLAGKCADIFVPHRFDVTALLKPPGQQNDLLVRIDPSVLAGRDEFYPGEWAIPGFWEHLDVRKSAVRSGWDMCPRIVAAGLWQDVRLELTSPTHFRSAYWTTKVVNVQKHTASVIVDWDIATDLVDLSPLKVRLELSRNGKIALQKDFEVQDTHFQQCMDGIENVDFWWPRGFGEPALYDAKLTLLDASGKVIDERKDRIGIRTMELMHTDTTSPESPGYFYFLVNGQKCFIRGVNWPYLDAYPSREAQRLEKIFPLLANLNTNLVRIHGADLYGSDRFFDLCDENGIMVWQDFMIANVRVPQTDAFRKVIADEAAAIIPKLRNHPSLALWCGGNEVDSDYIIRDGIDPNSDTISRVVIPDAIQLYDPYRMKAYLPSCPYFGPGVFAKGVQYSPEVHLYLFRPPYYFKAPFFTTDVIAPFASEIGDYSIPPRASMEQMLDPQFLNPWTKDHQWNDEWKVKVPEVRPTDNNIGFFNTMTGEMNAVFTGIPDDLDDIILASEAEQGEAFKFWVDSWRIRKWDRSGIMLWSFQDGWPIISYGIVDYYNRPKLGYYFTQESFRDVQAICGEAENGRHPVVIVNDTLQPVQGRLIVTRAGETAALLDTRFHTDANGKVTAGAIPDPKTPEMWQMDWKLDDGREYKAHYLATQGKVPFRDYVAWLKKLGEPLP
jgi:beta-mannosidase